MLSDGYRSGTLVEYGLISIFCHGSLQVVVVFDWIDEEATLISSKNFQSNFRKVPYLSGMLTLILVTSTCV